MNVRELIELLQKHDPEAVVFVYDDLYFESDLLLAPQATRVTECLTGAAGGMAVTLDDRTEYWSRPAVVIRGDE